MAARRDPEPDPTPGEAPTPDAPTVDAPAVDEKPADTVTLAVGHPYDALVLHEVLDGDGKPLTITSTGTEVPVADEDAVRKAAKDAGASIRKVR